MAESFIKHPLGGAVRYLIGTSQFAYRTAARPWRILISTGFSAFGGRLPVVQF